MSKLLASRVREQSLWLLVKLGTILSALIEVVILKGEIIGHQKELQKCQCWEIRQTMALPSQAHEMTF